MSNYEGTKTDTVRGGKKQRARYQEYTSEERDILRSKLLSDNWQDLPFLGDFWNIVHDERDLEQYRRMAMSWQLQSKGIIYKHIGNTLFIDPAKACAYVRGLNCRPNIAQMYLIHARLGKPREGWKWILDSTPKPIDPYPQALQVPDRIRDYNDVLEFLKQFPTVPEDSEALKFFGLTSQWAEQHKAELFWFLLGFLVGDAGKYYPEYESRSRHNRKSAMITHMSLTESNFRVLRYVQLCLEVIGIKSHQIASKYHDIRWNSDFNNIMTWIIHVCLNLPEGKRTSTDKLEMPWLDKCPRELLVALVQGLAESDGNVEKHGYYADISSVPNSERYMELLKNINVESRVHPKSAPQQVRMLLQAALSIPLFNPIIRSYRHDQLLQHAIRRKLIPPPPLFPRPNYLWSESC